MAIIGTRQKDALAWIRMREQTHHLAAPCHSGNRIAIGDGFAVDGDIGRDATDGCVSARCVPEPRLHFVEDQYEPVLVRQAPRSRQIILLGLDDAYVL